MVSSQSTALRHYELMYIISPEVAEEHLAALMERVSQMVVSKGGKVQEVAPWGRRKLAYPIGRFREGHYVLAQVELPPPQVRELEASLQIAEEVLRYLLVRVDSRG